MTRRNSGQFVRGVSARGFSFVEILFAVMILGIGTIMIASLLPVGVRQSQLTAETAAGINAHDCGVRYIDAAAKNGDLARAASGGDFPHTEIGAITDPRPAQVVPWSTYGNQRHALHSTLGNRTVATDPRFAWLGMYQREGSTTTVTPARFWVVAIQARNTPTFPAGTWAGVTATNYNQNSPAFANGPQFAKVATTEGVNGPDLIYIYPDDTSGNPRELGRSVAVEGAWVMIASDESNSGNRNGHWYVLGRPRPDLEEGVFELESGFDMPWNAGIDGVERTNDDLHWQTPTRNVPTTGELAGTYWRPTTPPSNPNALIVGRGLRDPSQPFDPATNRYEGPSMVIGLPPNGQRTNPSQPLGGVSGVKEGTW
jgi:type II secretory pathway pseudopilin PulG